MNALLFNGTNCELWCDLFSCSPVRAHLCAAVGCSVLLVRLCPQLFALKPSETPSGPVTSQKEHDEVFWCESVTHRRSKSLGCIYHLNFFTPLLKKKWHSC